MLRFIFAIAFIMHSISLSICAPRKFTCVSFMEDDKTLGDEDYTYDYSAAGYNSGEKMANDSAVKSTIATKSATNSSSRQLRVCPTDYTFCFSLWRQTTSGTQIEKQGCWKESTERNATCSHSECTSSAPTSRNNSLYYCCCSGDVCNQRMTVVEPSPLQLSKDIGLKSSAIVASKQRLSVWVSDMLWVFGLATAIILTGLLTFYHCNMEKTPPDAEQSPLTPSGPGYSSNSRNVDNINLVGMLGCGKYGTVMKGILHDEEVAVKIYPDTYYQYFVNERNIYSLPLMNCPALLTYFGYDEGYTLEGKMEYKLVLSLAPLGCLQEWLISNCMTFEIFCGIMKSITRGLSHLHTELRSGDLYKPCIAHRDLNSRNILVKADHTCCIADFGFALKVFGSKYEYKGETSTAETKSINEVGTLRYMAPELLEGAVNLRDCESSLKQMDVYALGLLLWEISTRCTDFYSVGQVIQPYIAPYEQEVGPHPTFDQMQNLVVRRKARPLFPTGWGGGPAAKVIRDTCEDCWDHDAEARLTALCAEERMHEMSNLRPRQNTQLVSPLFSANNLVNDTPQGTCNETEQKNIQSLNSGDVVDGSAPFQPPPNQQLPTEKNLMGTLNQQLQPYQGRNPCQERNLAPLDLRIPQVLIEKSKKHSFQNTHEQSLSCFDDDVSVEELISSGRIEQTSNLGKGFPKQQNTDLKLGGWHGVRALIHKKLFRKEDVETAIYQFGPNECKSNLTEPRVVTPPTKNQNQCMSVNADKELSIVSSNECTSIPAAKRPSNLDLSPLLLQSNQAFNNILRSSQKRDHVRPMSSIQSCENHVLTPAHVLPKSISATNCSSQKLQTNTNNINNNTFNNSNNELKILSKCKIRKGHQRNHSTSIPTTNIQSNQQQQFRRQHSLEVFREVFNGQGSAERLRDPSQRVKTPGDVPPSVRKMRASKALSLYDDRFMESSLLNIL